MYVNNGRPLTQILRQSLYSTRHFLCFALAIKPNANGMYNANYSNYIHYEFLLNEVDLGYCFTIMEILS